MTGATIATGSRWPFLALLLGGMVVSAATNAGFDEGLAAYTRGDYAAAVREWTPLATEGSADAQFVIGLLYSDGDGVPQDYSTAAYWYRKAAEQGHARAGFHLSMMYAIGRGVVQDDSESIKWMRKSAQLGYAPAHGYLGLVHLTGVQVSNDPVLASFHLELAVAGGEGALVTHRDRAREALAPEQLCEARELLAAWVAGMPLPTRLFSKDPLGKERKCKKE